jgi:hypothetical protein
MRAGSLTEDQDLKTQQISLISKHVPSIICSDRLIRGTGEGEVNKNSHLSGS